MLVVCQGLGLMPARPARPIPPEYGCYHLALPQSKSSDHEAIWIMLMLCRFAYCLYYFNSFTKIVCCYISQIVLSMFDVLVIYELPETMNEWNSGFGSKKESLWSLQFFAGIQGIPTEESHARVAVKL